LKLNLGCENEYLEGWINIDFDKRVKSDFCFDLNKVPYFFEENSVDEVLASGILEHLDNVSEVMMELYRICKHKAKIYILVPHFSDPFKHTEFEHKHFFSHQSFGEWWCNKELFPYFKVLKKKISFTRVNFRFMNILNPIINLFPRIYERLFAYSLPSSTIIYVLEVRKDKEFQREKKVELDYMEDKNKVNNLRFIKEI